ncbi:putative ABC transport system permease protein [Conyzicola lurida]|uniref:Putative ABC transport system permease protein n=1 Tax=Conyzicola lurida TaxID=1172621 RepID=A0A841APS2_9MICO|nr:hypothetical protein [Conyzicola lurida]MBB5843761.1 putative ABC transport system permease protein [Conyzicola lurida]
MSTAERRLRPSSARSRWASARRSLVGAAGLLVRRRARRDAALLAGWSALLCIAAGLALGVPRLVLDTVDRGSRAAVAEIGSDGDVIVRTRVGSPNAAPENSSLADVVALADELPTILPDGLASVAGTPTLSVLSPDLRLTRIVADPAAPRVDAQFGYLGPDQESGLSIVEGRLPTAGAGEIEVVVSRAAADAASLSVDSVFRTAATGATADGKPATAAVRVVGIATSTAPVSADECASRWCDLPTMWEPLEQDSRAGGPTTGITMLAGADGLALVQPLLLDASAGSIRVPMVAERFTSGLVATVVAETDVLEATGGSVATASSVALSVHSEFPDALRGYESRAAASVAQMSLMIAGLFGAVLVVMLHLSGLLVRRRAADLALERARGASLGSVVIRGLVESALLAVVGVGVALAAVVLLAPGPLPDPVPLVAVAVVAVLAPPAQALVVARAVWSGRRQPANRRDRQQLAGRAHARRIVLELAVVLVAVAAVVSVRSRGLVEARTDGTDPLLAAAPLLLAAAVTLVVLRLQPVVVRAVAALASRSRGAVGILAAAHARRALSLLPLLALTVAVALVVGGSLVVQTVSRGQDDASWQRVGADARIDGAIDEAVAERVRDSAGVTAVSAQYSERPVEIDSGAASAPATVVAVDSGFADLAALLPDGAAPGRGALGLLAAASAPAGAVPVLVDEALATRIDVDDTVMVFDDQRVPVVVVGTFEGGPDGYLTGPFVYVGIDALGAVLPDAVQADTLLVMGEGAADAARSVDGAEVLTRTGWLAERRAQPLVQGVERMTWLAVGAVALLAALALLTTVAAGGRSRSRSLSLLRTLGVQRGFGWILALAELTPLVVAALVGGAAAGVGIVVAVGPALGLGILAGGVSAPPLRIDVLTVVLVIAGSLVLSAAAIVVDVVAHRRDRPGEVLRVGETE